MKQPSGCSTNLVMYRLPHEKKITGLSHIQILTLSLRDSTSRISANKHAFREYAAHQGRREQVGMVLV